MKKGKNANKQILSLALAFCLILGMAPQAQAAGVQNGLDGLEVNTATATTVHFAGHEWVGMDDSGGKLTLLHLSGDRGASVLTAVEYAGSGVQVRMEELAGALDPRESAAILPRTLTAAGDEILGPDVEEQMLWALSKSEAQALNKVLLAYNGDWWLRTGYYDSSWNRYMVNFVGGLFNRWEIGGSDTGLAYAARPALYLDKSMVLFTTDASPGNAKPAGVTGVLDSAQAPGGVVKLTLPDDGQVLEGVEILDGIETAELEFAYDAATTGQNQFISCVLEQNGTVKYYGKLEDVSGGASGTVSVPLSGVANGDYILRIFSEQDNGGTLTDFAGGIHEFPVEVQGGTGTVTTPLATPARLALKTGESGTIRISLGTSGNRAAGVSVTNHNPSAVQVDTDYLDDDGTITVTGLQPVQGGRISLGFSGGDLTRTTRIDITVNVTEVDGPGPGPGPDPEPGPGPDPEPGPGPDPEPGPGPDPEPGPGPGPDPTPGSGGGSSRSSGGSVGANASAKVQIPASAFGWDGRTLTIDHDGLTPSALLKVEWDGEEITAYTARSGSVIIEFDADFLSGQSAGAHTVGLQFWNHSGTATVTVGQADSAAEDAAVTAQWGNVNDNPSTGGEGDNPATGSNAGGILPAVALGGALLLLAKRKPANR